MGAGSIIEDSAEDEGDALLRAHDVRTEHTSGEEGDDDQNETDEKRLHENTSEVGVVPCVQRSQNHLDRLLLVAVGCLLLLTFLYFEGDIGICVHADELKLDVAHARRMSSRLSPVSSPHWLRGARRDPLML